MKCTTQSSDTCKEKTRQQGWHAETYCEPDPDGQLEEDAHHHTRATFSASGGRSSTSTLLSQGSSKPPQPLPSTTFTASTNIHEDDGYFLARDSLDWTRYGIMDPEDSAAWDEEHGLKDKRARTASVSFLCIP